MVSPGVIAKPVFRADPVSMKPLPALLVLTGALPFLSATLSLVAGGPFHQTIAVVMLVTYAAVILSFLGGIHWGLALKIMDSAPTSASRLFVLSVLPALAAWAVLFLVADPRWQLVGMFVILLAVWALDGLLSVQGIIPRWFFRLRSLITAIVGSCFVIAWFALSRAASG
ncbi:MAG: DUF3429 domain-containing protein [Burkholderiales bacterium]|nr:DUF3429 domain-containing protein [Burkholderiales bacterium]